MKSFKGTGVALVTPFNNYGSVDFNSLGRIIDNTISNHVDYLVVMGTTGESATLSKDEKMAVLNFTADKVDRKIPIVYGIGGNNTQEVVNYIKSISFENIDAILSVCPYYNKPQQKGLYYHFKTISSVSPVPVILYNVPGRTSCNLKPETVLSLAYDMANIIGIKEASGDLLQVMELINKRKKGFLVISGDDALTLPMIAAGADGVISVVANAFPGEFSEMVKLALSGDFAKAKEIHYSLLDIINSLFIDGNPAGIKAALSVLNLCHNNLRLPLVKVNKAANLQISNLIQDFKNNTK